MSERIEDANGICMPQCNAVQFMHEVTTLSQGP